MIPIVFLHVPKTAGQTVHNELVRVVGGAEFTSPVRVTAQAIDGRQMPDGYRLYSGHIDWIELPRLPSDRFVFTILRDPRERIASFYLYMCKLAKEAKQDELEDPQNVGKRMALNLSADDYFFGGTEDWHHFVRSMYDNFYCSYFATRKMNGWSALQALSQEDRVTKALQGLDSLSAVYSIDNLAQLEMDVASRYGVSIRVAGNYFNTGGHHKNEARWPKLCALFEKDQSIARLEAFAALDQMLLEHVFRHKASTVVEDIPVIAP
ncbi:sulfotransferase family 2 domain-containing protein [Roseovarius phycicola]|uniref:Sulfotransferase family 2 domain-containing protein n=1 Tax=Roseovarius phycicola TaxID=3080976 RepID=A0ABZ2HG42_9RHOB